MPKNSRAKGCRGELLARDLLIRLGFKGARRTQQFNGLAEDGDVDGGPQLSNVHIEVKVGAVREWDLGTKKLSEACKQAKRDAKGKPWVVLWKPDRKCWRLTLEMQAPGFPVGIATVTDEAAMKAILISKQSLQPKPTGAKPGPLKGKAAPSLGRDGAGEGRSVGGEKTPTKLKRAPLRESAKKKKTPVNPLRRKR